MAPHLTASIAIGLAVFLVVIVAALLAQRVADKERIAVLQVDLGELQGDYGRVVRKYVTANKFIRSQAREIAELRAKEQKRQDQRNAALAAAQARNAERNAAKRAGA